MTRKHIRVVALRKWFPPKDPLAVFMARLCILREDCMLEFHGMFPEEIPELDEHSSQWRRLYFFRNSIRTLMEIFGVVQGMQSNAEFKRILAKRPRAERLELQQFIKQINVAHVLVKKLRNSIGGGHVQHGDVQAMLDDIGFGRWGFFEAGELVKDTHFKFAGELVAATMAVGIPEAHQVEQLEADIKQISELLPVVVMMEKLLLMYVEARGLI
jgi:hypothetical protein